MKILQLSDTHGCHHRLHDLPDADVIVHYGDFTMNGSQQEAIDFMDCSARHGVKIIGNTIFSNGTIMTADYTNQNAPNVIEI